MAKPKMLSLFSGCGGLDCGFVDAGFDLVLGTDNDALAAESHRRNFPASKFFLGDIESFTQGVAEQILGYAVQGEIDLLVGGPPCPPFSKSRFYRTDKPRAMDDPVGEATIGGYLRTLEWLRPKAFLLENVAGMSFKVHQETLQHIILTAEALGYNCSYKVLNAADFGVPQIRQRFFIVGLLNGEFRWPEPTHSEEPDGASLLQWVSAGEAIGDLDTEENATDEGHFAGGKHNHLLKLIPPGDNYLFLTAKRGYPDPQFEWRKRYWSFLLKLSPSMPSWTIQARRSNNMGPLHWRNRILRIAEVARLQTFPDSWFLAGTIEQQWRQVGNAVPPRLALAIAEQLLSQIVLSNVDRVLVPQRNNQERLW